MHPQFGCSGGAEAVLSLQPKSSISIAYDSLFGRHDDLTLLELDEKLLPEILHQRVTLRGQRDEDAVLCTSSKTYAVKFVGTSNSVFLIPPSYKSLGSRDMKDDDDISTMVASVIKVALGCMELVDVAPKLDKLKLLLSEHPYSFSEESEMDISEESKKSKMGRSLEIDGYWRTLDDKYMNGIPNMLLHNVILNDWSTNELDEDEVVGVRYLALLIIYELFMRSKLFRTLLVENLDQLLSLSVGFRRNHPLPAPASVASILRSKAIVFLEKWNDSFGINYRQLRLGYDYLKNTLRFQFPNLHDNAARVQLERREREIRTKEILLKKFESLKENFSSLKEEILSKIDEINECLEILRTEDDDEANIPLAPTNDDEEMEEFRNSELRQIRLDSIREGEKVHENSENEVVFDALRELHKGLTPRFRDTALKDLIDLRNLIQSTNRKCQEEDDDIWEDGAIETFEKAKFSPICSGIASTSDGTRVAENDGKSVKGKSKKNHNSELLKEAPVLNWGSFLDNWRLERDSLADQRGSTVTGVGLTRMQSYQPRKLPN
ncbi:hypothetical protein CASFOL_007555 [Castilleja foliolosa]|uniref:Uncharacterized protein n=1 Tax=Castilleja foliolosa TaxID=1961234 RepID=A0ABD3EAA8_9LAMI